MDEYISRHDVLLHSEIIRVYSNDYGNIDVVPVEYLADISVADVQPVKHGRWEINCDGYYPYCSNCKNEPQGREMTLYCPNCGARMRMDGDSK